MSRAGRRLSPAEIELWLSVTETVARREGALVPQRPAPPPAAAAPSQPRPVEPPRPPAEGARARPAGPAPLAPFEKRYRRRIARGHVGIEAALDLHGLTQTEAHAALIRFLRDAFGDGHRLVLVVTGKGRARSADEPGVLRRAVPHWLRAETLRPLVMGFEVAGAGHGDAGALYVRLRRSVG